MEVWFTACLHLGHDKAIERYKRPFRSVIEMDMALTECWNSVVKSGDTVYVLGDFAREDVSEYRRTLNGRIIMIWGNYDKKSTHHCFDGAWDNFMLHINKAFFWLSHYPHVDWPQKNYGSFHMHGHSHGSLNSINLQEKRLDVSVDCHVGADGQKDFKPFSLAEVNDYFKMCSSFKQQPQAAVQPELNRP